MTSVAQKRVETRKLLRSVLLPNKKGLLLATLEKEYRGMTGFNLPFRSLGYSSLIAMVTDMADVVSLVKLSSGHLVVMATPDDTTQHIADMVASQKDNMEGYNQHTARVLAGYRPNKGKMTNLSDSMRRPNQPRSEPPTWPSVDPTVPSVIKTRLAALVSKFPSGLEYSMLGSHYRQLYGEDLVPLAYGQISGLELCCQLPDVIRIQQLDKEGRDWLLLPVGSPPTIREKEDLHPTQKAVWSPATQESVRSTPQVVADTHLNGHVSLTGDQTDQSSSLSQWSDQLSIQQVPSTVCVGDYLEVVVTAVRSPSKLYLQLRDMQDKLWEMSCELARVMQVKQDLELRVFELRRGLNLAMQDGDHWCRVVVLAFREETVKVFLWDYGTIIRVSVTKLRHLPRHLAKLPAQAIPASLAGIVKPRSVGRWPDSTSTRLKQLIVDSHGPAGAVLAQVGRLTHHSTRLAVVLVDTQSNEEQEGVIINQILVSEGLAVGESTSSFDERQQQLVDKLNRVCKLVKENNLDDIAMDRLDNMMNDLEIVLNSQKEDRVMKVAVGQELLNVVLWKGKSWCVSMEISKMVQDWRGWDMLDRMVNTKNMTMANIIMTSDMDTKLWEEMGKMEVGGIEKGKLSLYLLQDVPNLVRSFARPETWGEILNKLDEVVKRFC